MFLLALTLLARDADAAACVCARNVALPSAGVLRPWAGVFALDYGAKLEADPDLWRGLAVKDLHGDSMAGMYMPPMLVHTASLSATLGLPAHFSVSTTLPYMYKDNLGESEMRGDTDLSSLNDIDLTAHWALQSKDMKTFLAVSAGPTFPSGTVVPNSPVRSGRGVAGVSVAASAGTKIHPKVAIAAQVSGATGFGADAGGYVVAPTASLVAGAQWWPRENGRLSVALLGIERWSGTDRQDALVYQNSGYLVTDLAAAASYTFWEQQLRSATVNVRAQAPVYQVVGDPMYAENFGGSVGISVMAF
jgi:hypothetical protein